MKKIECLILDWAGTAVDYGCFAPVAAFSESFRSLGLNVGTEEIRAHMGLTKIEEIRALFRSGHTAEEFRRLHGRPYEESDVQACYAKFQEVLLDSLGHYSAPIGGVVETLESLRERGLTVGSTTGYTREMMDRLLPAAAARGYWVDDCVTADGLPGGRPYPYMIYRNMCDLAVSSPRAVLKLGDTLADIREGLNAGAWSAGVILGSNELGLTEEEVSRLPPEELRRRMLQVRYRMYAAGAHYVIDSISELPALVDAIGQRMNEE